MRTPEELAQQVLLGVTHASALDAQDSLAAAITADRAQVRAEVIEELGGEAYPGKGDPWGDFLHHRARVLLMFEREGKSPKESAYILSMEPVQVTLILDGVRSLAGPPLTEDGKL